MKPILLLLSFFLTSVALAQDNPWDQKLPFKQATISYDLSGMLKGHKTLYIKDYGKTTALHIDTAMTVFGMKQVQKELEITTPDWVYYYDLTSNTGSKQANPIKFFIAEFESLSSAEQKIVATNAEKFGVNMMEGLDGEVVKNAATILGFKCDKTKAMGTEVYSIKDSGIPLKIIGNTMGIKYSEVATKVDKSNVSNSYFKGPENITLRYDPYADEVLKKQAKSVIQNLLEGKPPAQNSQTTPQEEKISPEQQEQMKKMLKMFGG
ncbi:hypothetical protein JCM30760_04490 [Thiomicrorhabdus hydrogeniphila]